MSEMTHYIQSDRLLNSPTELQVVSLVFEGMTHMAQCNLDGSQWQRACPNTLAVLATWACACDTK